MTTKVWMTGDLLDYRQWMKEELRDVIRQNYIDGVEQSVQPEDLLASESLLPAPQIMAMVLDYCGGPDENYMGIEVFHDFPLTSVHVTIRDDRGNLIESGEAYPFLDRPGLWDYLPTGCSPRGTTVIVAVVAMDYMGGIAVWQERERIQ